MNPSTLSLVSAIEMFQQNHQLYFSPNLGIRYFRGLPAISGVNVKLSLSCLKMYGIKDFRLTPEIGYTIRHWLNISYGYNLNISENQTPSKGNHKLSLYVIINRYLLKK